MPPELLRFVARPGSEGEARKEAERVAAALDATDAHGLVFFAGSAVLVTGDADWPPSVFDRKDVQAPLWRLFAVTVSDPARLEDHRFACLDSWGRFEGRGVCLRASVDPDDGRRVLDALVGVPDDVLRAHGVHGWAAFGRRGDLVLVFRGGERLAEGVRTLVAEPPRRMPLADRLHPTTVWPAWVQHRHAWPDDAVGRLRTVLDETTSFEPGLPAMGLFPDLLHLDDARVLGAWGPWGTEALPGTV